MRPPRDDETAELAAGPAADGRERNDAIFEKLEDAVTVSMEPLEKMSARSGFRPKTMLDTVAQRLFGQGGPLAPLTLSTKGEGARPRRGSAAANEILKSLDTMNLYRIAARRRPSRCR